MDVLVRRELAEMDFVEAVGGSTSAHLQPLEIREHSHYACRMPYSPESKRRRYGRDRKYQGPVREGVPAVVEIFVERVTIPLDVATGVSYTALCFASSLTLTLR